MGAAVHALPAASSADLRPLLARASIPTLGAALFALALSLPVAAQGLKLVPEPDLEQRWQARLQISRLDEAAGSRLLSANLLGDYYLTGSWLGSRTRGGLRATGGLMLGSPSLVQSSGGLALGSKALGRHQLLSVGQRQFGQYGLAAELEGNHTAPYLGIGYTGQSLRGGWGFTADLGLMGSSEREALRLGPGRASSQSLQDVLLDLRLRPVLQFGLSYSY